MSERETFRANKVQAGGVCGRERFAIRARQNLHAGGKTDRFFDRLRNGRHRGDNFRSDLAS